MQGGAGAAGHEGVSRWTKSVDLFEKVLGSLSMPLFRHSHAHVRTHARTLERKGQAEAEAETETETDSRPC